MKKILVLAVILLGCEPLLTASEIRITSPDTAQTYAFSSIIWKQLRWNHGAGSLVASITFSNYEYASRVEPRADERFDFAFPGITFDRATGIFSAHDSHGTRIPVAVLRHELFFPVITLLPGGQVSILKRSGKLKVELIADSEPIAGERWVEREQQQILPGF